ncbi:malic enzyme-like protein [Streptomyces sp. NPDC007984]|uniref:malic enzyme-like protein n=1 Tax=Streptomyces sp. NPDC007984 TaxID=3364801 RepID=UPI0036E976DD
MPATPPAGANPAFSIRVHVPAQARAAVEAIAADAPGAVSSQSCPPDATGAHRVLLDADSGSTLAWLTGALRDRLGADLLLCEDLVFATASTGKLSQSIRASTASDHDVALLDADADRRVIRHLVDHPEHVNRYTGRAHRVALVSDASAVLDFEYLPASAALPAVESQAVHLRRTTGLDILPLPVAADSAGDLAAAVRLLAPAVVAAVLIHTRIDHVHVARAALTDSPVLLLDSINDGLAIATAAAAYTTLRRHDIDVRQARVVCVSPNRGGDLGGLLIAGGITDLTLYDPLAQGIQPLHQLAEHTDLIVDLFGLLAPPVGIPVLHARPETPPSFAAATTGPRPLHALPGLLAAAVATGRPITAHARIAAVRALVEQTQPGQTLPPLDHPGLTPAVTSAAVTALMRDSDED